MAIYPFAKIRSPGCMNLAPLIILDDSFPLMGIDYDRAILNSAAKLESHEIQEHLLA